MKVTINGEARVLADGITLEQLLTETTGSTRGSAVVVDGEVVPRSAWPQQPLRDGQTVELITAVQGG
jgi:sulfur carrier protein